MIHNSAAPSAKLVEIFSAIQGEGQNVGTRQIFIRFALCDLRCHFCDSAHTWQAPSFCRVERSPGLRDFINYANPVEMLALRSWIEQLNRPGLHDSISLTGGEPLLHAPFLVNFLPVLRETVNLPIYLETGGHRPMQLETILPYLDAIGMDIKLPSASGENHWKEHAAFLAACCRSNSEVFVKIIIANTTTSEELEQAAELVAAANPAIPVYLQPATPLTSLEASRLPSSALPIAPPPPETVLVWQELMKRSLKSVRVVPQTHKMLGQM